MAEYLLSVWHKDMDDVYASEEETQAAYAAVGKFNEELQEKGYWVFAGGLQPPDTATVVDNSKGADIVMTDGPFAESKEQLGGFWVVNAKDLDEALALAAQGSRACGGPVEVRPFQG